MNKFDIITKIHSGNYEIEILLYLQNWLIDYANEESCKKSELKASLRAINKINNGENEAIHTLCEYNG